MLDGCVSTNRLRARLKNKIESAKSRSLMEGEERMSPHRRPDDKRKVAIHPARTEGIEESKKDSGRENAKSDVRHVGEQK